MHQMEYELTSLNFRLVNFSTWVPNVDLNGIIFVGWHPLKIFEYITQSKKISAETFCAFVETDPFSVYKMMISEYSKPPLDRFEAICKIPCMRKIIDDNQYYDAIDNIFTFDNFDYIGAMYPNDINYCDTSPITKHYLDSNRSDAMLYVVNNAVLTDDEKKEIFKSLANHANRIEKNYDALYSLAEDLSPKFVKSELKKIRIIEHAFDLFDRSIGSKM